MEFDLRNEDPPPTLPSEESHEQHRPAPTAAKSCFTPIPPTRRLPPNGGLGALCPSMDLMVVGSTSITTATDGSGSTEAAASTSSTLSLHRTMNPQKLSHKTLEHAAPGGDTTTTTGYDTYGAPQERPAVLCGWRSDGRVLAVVAVPPPLTKTTSSSDGGDGGGEGSAAHTPQTDIGGTTTSAALCLQQYAVEDLLHEWHASPAVSVVPVTVGDPPAGAGVVSAAALAWTFRGQPHPSWPRSEQDEERQWCQENVRFPVRFPRSDYHLGYTYEESSSAGSGPWSTHPSANSTILHHHPHDAVKPHVLPSAAPLSLLSLVTVNRTTGVHQLSAYLHGRFPWIENLPLVAPASSPLGNDRRDDEKSSSATASAASVQVAVSNTLTHVAVVLPQSSLLVARIPHSDAIATMAASLVALEYHLSQLEGKVPEMAAVLASSLKPLDAKLDALVNTMTRYSIAIGPADPTASPAEASGLPSHRYSSLGLCLASWIMGTTSSPSPLASAMEQYFASAQMNDQLLVRMDQSLTVALANVETLVHRNLLAPSRVLLVHTSDVVGTVLAAAASVDGVCGGGGDYRTGSGATPTPLFGTDTVEAAHRLHLTAAQLLGQAERLAAEAVDARFAVRDWVRWLRAAGSAAKARGTPANSPLHQNALQRRVPDGLVKRLLERLRRPPLEQQQQEESQDAKPSQPTPLRKAGWTQQVLHLSLAPDLDLIPVSTASLRDALRDVPLGPRRAALDRTHVRSYTLGTQPRDRRRLSAVTTRLGGGGCPRSRLLPSGSCFAPPGGSPRSVSPKEWIVTATALSATGVPPSVTLHAVPLVDDGIEAPIADDDPTAWMVRLALDAGVRRVLDLAFYGDDGKSSLSGMDGGTGHERRQALALLVESQRPPGSGLCLELWLIPYDDCPFAPVPMSDSRLSLSEDAAVPVVQVTPQPPLSSGDRDENRRQTKEDCIHARTRQLSSFGASSSAQLVVSGSRGVGAVLVKDQSTGTTLLDLYDLEEDDGEDDDDDDSGSYVADGMSTED